MYEEDSSLSAKYIILHTVFIATLQFPKMQYLLFELDTGFADETLVCMQLKEEKDVDLINEAFQFIGLTTGLHINIMGLKKLYMLFFVKNAFQN